MGNKDCSILVTSCDAYRDIERPFVTLFRKYWPDCPFELVLVTETANGAASTADSDTPQFDRIHATGKGKNWCQMLAEALAQIETPYVLLLMNDYLLTSPVDTHGFQHRLAQAETFDAANLRLNPNPQGRIPWRDTDLLEYPKNTAYCVTCQTGIWNKNYLMKLAQQNKSAWEFERFGSFMVGDEKRPLLVTRQREFPFIDAVHKGYWEKSGIELCRRNGIPIDFTARGRPPFHVKVREAFKSLIFAIFPWTFIVRLQNLFNIGMKERPRPTAAQTPQTPQTSQTPQTALLRTLRAEADVPVFRDARNEPRQTVRCTGRGEWREGPENRHAAQRAWAYRCSVTHCGERPSSFDRNIAFW